MFSHPRCTTGPSLVNPAPTVPLTAWGRSARTTSRLWTANTSDLAVTALRGAGPRGIIARGFARSYGDVCLNDGGDVVDVTPLTVIRHFDATTGVLRCDAGATYTTLMRHCLPHGWMPAVCPGTAVVSMGGAIANDVHGKNQHVEGNFGDHLDWFDLLLPDGCVRRVSQESDPDLFAATIGGIGLTGVILGLQMRLLRVPSNAIELTEIRMPNLDTFLERVRASEGEFPYAVGWIDALARGGEMGRGILELGRPSPEGVREPLGVSIRTPFDFPGWVLNRHSMSAFNSVYYHRLPRRGRTRAIHLNRFLYPLDAIHDWNRMYGRRGVFQFQCVVPFEDGRHAIIRLMEEISRSRGASFLAVLKSFGAYGRGLLSFPMPGFTLALDFPRRADTRRLIERLQDITLEHGGRVYLAKDACLARDQLEAMYPQLERFESVLRQVDPGRRMQSDMSRRLRLNVR